MGVESLLLECSVKTLRQLAGRITVCLGKLSDHQIWAREHENANAIGNLTLHLAGNVRQWIISSLGGAPDQRERDKEFAVRGGRTVQELSDLLNMTVEQAVSVISDLSTDRLTTTYTIQNYQVSGVEVVLHVVEHFAQHTGQIIFATKLITGEDLGFYRHLSAKQAKQ